MPPTASDKYAPTSWGSEFLEDVQVPSGQMCQCRRPGMQGLIKQGLLDNVDILTGSVQAKHVQRVKGRGKQPSVEDMSAADLVKVLDAVDKVVEYVVVQPTVVRPVTVGEDGEERILLPDERESGVIYTDMIEVEDKMFIFNYAVGGTRDVETFRRQSLTAVGGLGAVEDLEVQAQ